MVQLTIHFISTEVKKYCLCTCKFPCSIPSSWTLFVIKKMMPDIVLIPERFPICRTRGVDQCPMGTETCILVCLGLSTKCWAEDEVRDYLRMSSSTAKASQFNTPTKPESHCQKDQKTEFLSPKEMPGC